MAKAPIIPLTNHCLFETKAQKESAMNVDLTAKMFHDETTAREHLESVRWPGGPFCPHWPIFASS